MCRQHFTGCCFTFIKLRIMSVAIRVVIIRVNNYLPVKCLCRKFFVSAKWDRDKDHITNSGCVSDCPGRCGIANFTCKLLQYFGTPRIRDHHLMSGLCEEPRGVCPDVPGTYHSNFHRLCCRSRCQVATNLRDELV